MLALDLDRQQLAAFQRSLYLLSEVTRMSGQLEHAGTSGETL